MEGRRKRIAVLLSVAAAFAAIAGTAAARVDHSTATLDIYGYGPGDDVQENRATYAAGQLSGVTINREAPSFDDQAFLTRLASGNVPDLVRMPRTIIGYYAAKGVLQPVDSCVSSVKSQYRKGAMNAVTWKGHVYGLPEFTNQVTMIVNESDFTQAGLSVAKDAQTKNLSLLLKDAKKLTKFDGSGNLVRIGFDPKIDSGFGLPMWAKYFGGSIISADGLHAQLNSPAAVKAMNFAVSVINAEGGWNKFVTYRNTFDFFGAGNPLVKDQLAMWPMESFIYNVFANNSPTVDIVAKYFTNGKGGPVSFLSGNAWAIPKSSKDASDACAYMKAVTSVQAWSIAADKRVNARKAAGQAFTGLYTANAAADKKIYEDYDQQDTHGPRFLQAVQLLTNASKYGFELPPTPAGPLFVTAWNNAVNRILTGQQSAKASLDQAQKEAQAAINANK